MWTHYLLWKCLHNFINFSTSLLCAVYRGWEGQWGVSYRHHVWPHHADRPPRHGQQAQRPGLRWAQELQGPAQGHPQHPGLRAGALLPWEVRGGRAGLMEHVQAGEWQKYFCIHECGFLIILHLYSVKVKRRNSGFDSKFLKIEKRYNKTDFSAW